MSILLWHAPRISRKFAGVEIYSVVLRQQRKPHWVSPSFGSVISVASWNALFLRRLSTEMPRQLVHSVLSPIFVYGDHQIANLKELCHRSLRL